MPKLSEILSPGDLAKLSQAELDRLAIEIRSFLVSKVSKTGGHLGSNLGVVELTIALHRVFDSPKDVIIFDVGHQCYVHKILTGRQRDFDTLRQKNGLSGYPKRAESEHDWVENSHASTSLSWAYGIAKGFKLQGIDRHVVAVIGDGALTGGMAWEALNNLSTEEDLKLTIIVNDNGRSYTPTVGGLATQLSMLGTQLTAIRTDRRYERLLQRIKRLLRRTPIVGEPLYGVLHGVKTGVKDVLVPRSLFPDLGLKYVGPVNGNDEQAIESALERAKQFAGPVIVHCITEKGRGFAAAEQDEKERFHAVGRFDEASGEPLEVNRKRRFTDVFSQELVRIGERDESVVALTAAMLHPVGLTDFAEAFPERVFDSGIAEQHLVTTAAGLAMAGLHPIVAVYSTFINRAFDQVLMDVGLHSLGVTFVLDRAGVTGPDGPTHHGLWDVSTLGLVPGLHLAQPRDEQTLIAVLNKALSIDDAPTVIRYGKDAVTPSIPAVKSTASLDYLRNDANAKVLIVSYGLWEDAVAAGEQLAAKGISNTIVDPIWSLPITQELIDMAQDSELVVTIEDNIIVGGLGERLARALVDAGSSTKVHNLGISHGFVPQGSRDEILNDLGLSAVGISEAVIELLG